ncbi:hypothetical protein HDU67_000952, partial [Dinochytrium kinnereticum]
TLALILGLLMANLFAPTATTSSPTPTPPLPLPPPQSHHPQTYETFINHLTPRTWSEMANGELLQVLVASILFGCGTAVTPDPHRGVVVSGLKGVMEVMVRVVGIVIWMAPIGVLFSIAGAVAGTGVEVLGGLGKLVAVLHLSLFIFVVVVFGGICLLFKIPPLPFLKAIREPLIIAYTTGTSESALPKAFTSLTTYGVPPHITTFILPLGYSFNLIGSTLYLSLSSIFLSHLANHPLKLQDQLLLVTTLLVSSKGVAGVRGASLIVLAGTVEGFGISRGWVGVLVGVDWVMDMARSGCNVLGNCLAAVVVAKIFGEFRSGGWGEEGEAGDVEKGKGVDGDETVLELVVERSREVVE